MKVLIPLKFSKPDSSGFAKAMIEAPVGSEVLAPHLDIDGNIMIGLLGDPDKPKSEYRFLAVNPLGLDGSNRHIKVPISDGYKYAGIVTNKLPLREAFPGIGREFAADPMLDGTTVVAYHVFYFV